MKRFLISAVAGATLLAAAVPVAQAATVANNFNVSVTLTSQCLVTNATTPTIAFGTYTAFGAAISNVALSAPLTFKCTHKLPAPTVAFDTAGGLSTGDGVIAGLKYTLTAPVLTRVDGADAVLLTATAATQDTYSYTFSGNMAANQSGECITASTTSCAPTQLRQLIVTY